MSPPRIAVLTPDPADRDFHSRWRDVFGRTAAPLRAAGMVVEDRSWPAAKDLDRFDLVLPLLVWGYHRAGLSWSRATNAWEERGLRMRNPPSVLRWNADKRYLGRLAQRGAPVAPTLFVDRVDASVLEEASRTLGSEQLIAKPQISASAWQTIRWSPGGKLDGGPTGTALVQPYLPAIETEGEISLIFLDGQFSHGIRKRPQPGDFRVQPEYEGIITRHVPHRDELQAAEQILAQVDEALLYARVDLVRDGEDRPVLMELELVEPDLYLEHDPGQGEAFVSAIAQAASG